MEACMEAWMDKCMDGWMHEAMKYKTLPQKTQNV